jgi:hypothetical protein
MDPVGIQNDSIASFIIVNVEIVFKLGFVVIPLL